MNETLNLIVGTLTMRPYVFAFFAGYLLTAVPHLGRRRTFLFTVAGYLIAFVSEYLSINTGFPYGWYYYIDTTRAQELWVAGVPFFDSLSYVFLAYCSYSMALLIVSPLMRKGGDLVVLETHRIRRSPTVLLLAALLQAFLDIIIDPVALQGERWFLGKIYGYRETGIHFGVPLSNYLGWFFVSLVMVFALQQIDRTGERGKVEKGEAEFPLKSLMGPCLYVSVLAFNLGVAYYIGEKFMAMAGLFIVIPAAAITVATAVARVNRYRMEDLREHLADFPGSRAGSGSEDLAREDALENG